MIKGSLLCSVDVVKRFGRKFSTSKNGPKIEVFVDVGGDIFNPNNHTPCEINPNRNMSSDAQTASILVKTWYLKAGKKFYKKQLIHI